MWLATPKSSKVAEFGALRRVRKPLRTKAKCVLVAGLWLAWAFGSGLPVQAQDPSAGASDGRNSFTAAAQKALHQAQERYRKEPGNVEAALAFAQACYELGELPISNSERAAWAQQGIDACQKALASGSNSAAAHYYLGLNMGELARTETFGALSLVKQMQREFTAARALDEHLDYAGPDRCLGLLYRDAPSWGSIGSRSKAREHLQRAVQLAPNYPENRLNLLEAEMKWGDRDSARRELQSLEAALPAERATLSGPAWTASWADWDSRLRAAQQHLEQQSKKLESPRNKGG
jgi:hypothetical protein